MIPQLHPTETEKEVHGERRSLVATEHPGQKERLAGDPGGSSTGKADEAQGGGVAVWCSAR
jgi:hypothetical protein